MTARTNPDIPKMEIKKALYISRGLAPYLPASPLTETETRSAVTIQSTGAEVRAFMPKYGNINERRNQLHEVIRLSGLNIVIDDSDHPLIIKVATLQPSRMQVYFIDNDDYFGNVAPTTDDIESEPGENDERLIFFVRGVIETVKKLRWIPEMIHCSGWLSTLAPLYLRRVYSDDPALAETKIVYSLTDDAFNGTLDERFAEKLTTDGVDISDLAALAGTVDNATLVKLAIDFSDAIVETARGLNPEMVEYARKTGKPFLSFDEQQADPDAVKEFYKNL